MVVGLLTALGVSVTYMGASVPLYVFLLATILISLFKPQVFKWAMLGFFILAAVVVTDITFKTVFWVGAILAIFYVLKKKK